MTARLTGDWYLFVLAALAAVVIGATLFSWGQPLICTCGYVKLWVGSVFSSGNSQHIADWYTLSHTVHGMLIALVGKVIWPRESRSRFRVLFVIAIVTGTAWELVEHTDMVLDRFRAATLYQGYLGDSVLNAVSDYLFMLGGFFVAYAIKTVWSVVLIVAFEVTATIVARDSLTLTTLMLFHPIDAVEEWQQAINPNPVPET